MIRQWSRRTHNPYLIPNPRVGSCDLAGFANGFVANPRVWRGEERTNTYVFTVFLASRIYWGGNV